MIINPIHMDLIVMCLRTIIQPEDDLECDGIDTGVRQAGHSQGVMESCAHLAGDSYLVLAWLGLACLQ